MTHPISVILLVLGSFLLGSVPVGVIVSKSRGVNLFDVGSKSTGATNVYRALGLTWAIIVFLLDALKGAIPTLVARFLMPNHQSLWALVGVFAVVGHCYSPWIGFKGGKGVATILGVFLAASPFVALSGFGVFFIVLFALRYMSIASLAGVFSAAGFAILYHDDVWMVPLYLIVFSLTLYRHRGNLARLKAGTEPKFSIKKSDTLILKDSPHA